jgi:hypothetical protein
MVWVEIAISPPSGLIWTTLQVVFMVWVEIAIFTPLGTDLGHCAGGL